MVKGIDLYVDEGEIVTLIGANGAGKTTTMQTISGLTAASGVHGRFGLMERRSKSCRDLRSPSRGLCQVLEGETYFSQLTVLENLRPGRTCARTPRTCGRTSSGCTSCSRGWRSAKISWAEPCPEASSRCFAIARAMLGNPKMLLLDEPSLGLAPLIIKEIFEAIVAIREQGTTILFVEQNSKIALNTADRGYVMQTGEIILSDSCANLLQNEEVRKAYMGAE